jgi:putative endonuclease
MNHGSLHTEKDRPWSLETYLAFSDKHQALEFERYLKSHSGQAFASKRLWRQNQVFAAQTRR